MNLLSFTHTMCLSRRMPRRAILVVLVLMFSLSSASAQYSRGSSRVTTNPFGRGRNYSALQSPLRGRPSFSPYLNLLRSGDGVVNYYGLVRPEQEFRAANEQFQSQFNAVQKKIDSIEKEPEAGSNLGVTGHHVRFMSDPYGGTGSVTSTLSDRDQRSGKLPPTPGSRVAPTGHGAYFSNHGTFYTYPNR